MIVNRANNVVVAYENRIADTFLSRLKGLLGTTSLQTGQALLIKPCNSIHTVGMRYAIDVLFLSADLEVLKVVHNMTSMKITTCALSKMVLELPAGTATQTNTLIGHKLKFT